MIDPVFFIDITLIWWTPFTIGDKYIQCGNVHCLVTSDKQHRYSKNVVIKLWVLFFNLI